MVILSPQSSQKHHKQHTNPLSSSASMRTASFNIINKGLSRKQQQKSNAKNLLNGRYYEMNERISFAVAALALFLLSSTEVVAQTTVCQDIANWVDSTGEGCNWYGSKPNLCDYFGDCCEESGYIANTACCVCGGGEEVAPSPTPPPRPDPPTGGGCLDKVGWADAYGDDCSWYETNDPTCETFGNCCANADNIYPNRACCTCGGGSFYVHLPKSTEPRASPIKKNSSQPSASPIKKKSSQPSVGGSSSSSGGYSEICFILLNANLVGVYICQILC